MRTLLLGSEALKNIQSLTRQLEGAYLNHPLNEIPDILLQFFKDYIIQHNQHNTDYQNNCEIVKRRHPLVYEDIMVRRDDGEHRVPNQDLLGQRWKDLKYIDDRSEPEPDLESDADHLLEIPEEDDKHRKKEPQCVRKNLLDKVYDRDEQE